MVKINAVGTRFEHIVQAYKQLTDFRKIYKNDYSGIDFEYDAQGIPCYAYDNVEAINNDTSPIICIDNADEGENVIYRFTEYDPNKHYVILSNGEWSNVTLPFKYDLVPWYEFLYRYYANYCLPLSPNYFVDYDYKFEKNKEHLFCSLIGAAKLERDSLVEKIKENLHGISYILNYNGKQLAANSAHLDIRPDNFYSESMATDDFPSQTRLSTFEISDSIPVDIYNSGRFALVVETNGNTVNEFHLTEKLVKILLTGIPFVLVASSFYLSKIRNMGFLTFATLWDESYDNIIDRNERQDAIIKLVKDLNNFDWENNNQQLAMIADYNKRKLNEIIKRQFTEQLIQFEKVFNEIQE